MTAHEIEQSLARYHARLVELLSAEELRLYEAYQQRVSERLTSGNIDPVPMSPEEQAVADKISADTQAAALQRQFLALTRDEKLPQ